jgi:RNA polymerase sigma factor (sigma-70 family)
MVKNREKGGQKSRERTNSSRVKQDGFFLELNDAVKKIFFFLVGKGAFYFIRKHYRNDIEIWVQDLSQEISLEIWKKYKQGTLDEIKNLNAYIWKMVFFKSIDQSNKLQKYFLIDNEAEDSNESQTNKFWDNGYDVCPQKMLLKNEQEFLVRRSIQRLNPKHKLMIFLFYWGKLSCIKIAEIVGSTPNGVRVTLHNIRKKLKSDLISNGVDNFEFR